MKLTSENEKLKLECVVAAPMRETWELVSDTNRINHVVFGLPELDVKGVVGDVRRAGAMLGDVEIEFDEHPWIYESPRRFKYWRSFHKGPLDRLEVACELAEQSPSTTSLTFSIALSAKSGPVAWAGEKILAAQLANGLEQLGAILEKQHAARTLYVNPERDAVAARAAPYAAKLSGPHVAKLVAEIAGEPDDEVVRMRPYALAEKWGAPRKDVLALCLNASRAGLLELRWDTLCPSCRAALHSANDLANVKDDARCDHCDLDVAVTRDSNVELVFAPAAAVRTAKSSVYCLGSPVHTPHWIAQLVLDPDTVEVVQATLGLGRYVLQSPGIGVRTVVDVGDAGDDHVRITLEGPRGGVPPTLPAATPIVRAGRVKITLKNEDTNRRRIQIVNEGFADFSATAAHVVETEAWRALSATAA